MHTPDYLKDISDEELRQYAQRIEAVVSLAGDVAHDFNDILQSLRGNIELALLKGKDTDKNYINLKEVYEAVKRGNDLTNRLTTLGKPFERNAENRVLIEDINEEILRIKEIIDRNLPKRIKVSYSLQKDICPVFIDPFHIEQILVNLALNSIEAMSEEGELEIKTSAVYLDKTFCSNHKYIKPGNFVHITVQDTGTGIPDSIINHVFDPFFSTKSKKKKGELLATGLGLSVVNKIIKDYKGTIVINNKVNKGTQINIYLPICESLKESHHKTKNQISELKTGTEEILIIDDNDYVSKVVADMLNSFGYTASSSSPKNALIHHKSFTKLYVVDLVMPEFSGKQFLKEIKKIQKDIKVIIMTGYDLTPQQKNELYSLGMDGFIVKPYTTEQLLKEVRRVLDK